MSVHNTLAENELAYNFLYSNYFYREICSDHMICCTYNVLLFFINYSMRSIFHLVKYDEI